MTNNSLEQLVLEGQEAFLKHVYTENDHNKSTYEFLREQITHAYAVFTAEGREQERYEIAAYLTSTKVAQDTEDEPESNGYATAVRDFAEYLKSRNPHSPASGLGEDK